MNKLILGTVQMGLSYGINNTKGKISKEECFEILKTAYNSGIRFLDTAEAYGNAHDIIGDFHKTYPDLLFSVITKIPALDVVENIEDKIEGYLNSLYVSDLNTLMFHSFSTYIKNLDLLPTLHKIKEKGKFKLLGVSVYTNEEMQVVIEDERIDLIQLPFNLFDNLNLRGSLLKEAKKRGKVIHTRSVFLQGLFFKKVYNNNTVAQLLEDELKLIHNIAQQNELSLAALALNYCLIQECIDNVLIGVDSNEHLLENLDAIQEKLSEAATEEINNIHISNLDLLNPSLWNR